MTEADQAAYLIQPFTKAPVADVLVPGSKSITNRALLAAALANGASTLRGALFSDDTEAMISCLDELGIEVKTDVSAHTIEVNGCGGVIPNADATISVRQSGTTARFIVPLLALGHGRYVVDAHPQMRSRPMSELAGALRSQGVVLETASGDHLPFVITGHGQVAGSEIEVRGDQSSQFLSGLLLSAPYATSATSLKVVGELISRPYVDMTRSVMRAFGVEVDVPTDSSFVVAQQTYVGTEYPIEPDASAASYFFGLAAITGGTITIPGLGSGSMQGDMRFVQNLETMGCTVTQTPTHTTVSGPPIGSLRGGVFDMSEHSDTAPTMAVIAAFANEPTTITNIGFIRHKESDRVGGVVKELQRCGIRAEEHPDGLTVYPGIPTPATVETYDDHRMAMAFALLGCRAEGIQISNPNCVAKTFPDYFSVLDAIRPTTCTEEPKEPKEPKAPKDPKAMSAGDGT
jgi:3-phosphoshikimate 1-carboxyvinyltransferase